MSVRQTGISNLDSHILGEILIRADNPSAIARTSKYFRKTLYQTLLTNFVSQPSTRSFVPIDPELTPEEKVCFCVLNLKKFCSSMLLTPKNQLNPMILAGMVEKYISINTLIQRVKRASTHKTKGQLVFNFIIGLVKESLVMRCFSQESILRCETFLQKQAAIEESCGGPGFNLPQIFISYSKALGEGNGIELSEYVSLMNEESNALVLVTSMANNVDRTGCDDIEAVKMVLDSGSIPLDTLCKVIIQAIEFKNEKILTSLLPLLVSNSGPRHIDTLRKVIIKAIEFKNEITLSFLLPLLVSNSGHIPIDTLYKVIIQAFKFKNEKTLSSLLPLLKTLKFPSHYLNTLIMAAAKNGDRELTVFLMEKLPEISPTLYRDVERLMPTIKTRINPQNDHCIVC